MITQLVHTVKDISTIDAKQNAKPIPVSSCENKTGANNISGMKIINVKEKKALMSL